MEQLVARQAHNLEVVRSSRASATTEGLKHFVSNLFCYTTLFKVPYQYTKNKIPFGYSYLCDEKREWNKNWFDWDDLQTLEDMRNGKLLKFMKTRFEILKKYGIIEKL